MSAPWIYALPPSRLKTLPRSLPAIAAISSASPACRSKIGRSEDRCMGYRNLRDCVADLERTGQLIRIQQEIDPYLEAAEIQRRVYRAGGPALYFARVKGCA